MKFSSKLLLLSSLVLLTQGTNAHAALSDIASQYHVNTNLDGKPGKDEPITKHTDNEAISIAAKAYRHNPKTVDCGCEYATSRNSNVNVAGCGYASRIPDNTKTPQAQWSRVISLEELAVGRECTNGAEQCKDDDGHPIYGAQCCLIIDQQFRRMSHDAWDWIPMINEIAHDKDDKTYSVLVNGLAPYGNCQVKIDNDNSQIEPADKEKGVIARIILYYHDQWNVPITPAQEALYGEWNKDHPPTQDENQAASILAEAQKKENPYYTNVHTTEP